MLVNLRTVIPSRMADEQDPNPVEPDEPEALGQSQTQAVEPADLPELPAEPDFGGPDEDWSR